MRRNAALLAGIAAGTVAAILLRRRGRQDFEPGAGPPPDPRAEELRRKLAEAREQAADEHDFEAAGMAGEALIEDEPRPDHSGSVDEARRRVHEDARAAAEEMRRQDVPEDG